MILNTCLIGEFKIGIQKMAALLGFWEFGKFCEFHNVFMTAGNKCDCQGERVVRKEDGERLAREYNVTFMETSAKNGLNVELAFLAVAR